MTSCEGLVWTAFRRRSVASRCNPAPEAVHRCQMGLPGFLAAPPCLPAMFANDASATALAMALPSVPTFPNLAPNLPMQVHFHVREATERIIEDPSVGIASLAFVSLQTNLRNTIIFFLMLVCQVLKRRQ